MANIVYSAPAQQVVMTSLEVVTYLKAVNLAKDHWQVLEDIRNLKAALLNVETPENPGVLQKTEAEATESSYTNSQNKLQPMFIMNEEFVLLLIAGYDINTRIAMLQKIKSLQTQLKGLTLSNAEKQVTLAEIQFKSYLQTEKIKAEYDEMKRNASAHTDALIGGRSDRLTLKVYGTTHKKRLASIEKGRAKALETLEQVTRDAVMSLGLYQHEAIKVLEAHLADKVTTAKTAPVVKLTNSAQYARQDYLNTPLNGFVEDETILGSALKQSLILALK